MSLYTDYEDVTVSTAAVGLTAAKVAASRTAFITCEGGAVRYRLDGTAPTASVGHVLNVGGTLTLSGTDIKQVSFIRRDSVDGTLRVSYGQGPDNVGSPGSGASGVGTGAADIGKAEDAAHASGDVGIMPLGVFNSESATVFSSTNGDYVPLAVNTSGNLQVVGNRSHDATLAGPPLVVAGGAVLGVGADVSAAGDVVRAAYGLDGVQLMRMRPRTPWSITHAAAAGAQATASQASAGTGLKNVMRGFMVSVVATGAVAAAGTLTINIRDGATGAGTVLWSFRIEVPVLAAAAAVGAPIISPDLYLVGTAATAMTIESSAAPSDADVAITVNAWGEVSA